MLHIKSALFYTFCTRFSVTQSSTQCIDPTLHPAAGGREKLCGVGVVTPPSTPLLLLVVAEKSCVVSV